MKACSFFACVVVAAVSLELNAQSSWPQFRGPRGDGHTASTHPTTWAEEQGVAWKKRIEGFAWSQPIIWDDKVIITTAVADTPQNPKQDDISPGFSLFSSQGLSRVLGGGTPADIQVRWDVLCLQLEDGDILWRTTIHSGRPPLAVHRSNSYASATPATDGHRVYVLVSMAGLWCLNLDGELLWNRELANRPMLYGWGAGASPTLYRDHLYVVCDNEEKSYLAAFDKLTGDPIWTVPRNENSNWSTPYLWNNRLRTELVVTGGTETRSYAPSDGELLWSFPADGRTATTATGNDDIVIVGSVTRSHGSTSTLAAVEAGAEGTLAKDDELVRWSISRSSPELASPLLVGQYVYTAGQLGGILRCFDALTGRQHYRKRLPDAGVFTASPWTDGNHVFCLSGRGNTYVLKPSHEFNLLATNSLDGMFWSSAASANGKLLLRSADHLYCVAQTEE